MEAVAKYFLNNFFLLCLSVGVILMVVQNSKTRKVMAAMPICIVINAILISIAYAIEMEARKDPNLVFLATCCCVFGFAARPLFVLFFLMMAEKNKVILRIATGLVVANALIYATSLFIDFEPIGHFAFWYGLNEDGTLLEPFHTAFYYSSYIIVGIMTAYLIVISVRSLKGSHRSDAMASLVSVGFIVLSVILETTFVADNLLNTTVVIACLYYIIHLFHEKSGKDGLTGLFDRKTYYEDDKKLGSHIVGMILLDMNSLKYINDTKGHLEGDKAIKAIAGIIEETTDQRYMYAYRIGGDEFLIMSTSTKHLSLENLVERIKNETSKTPYTVSVGYCYRESPEQDNIDIFKKAETMMYEEKKNYYKNTGHDRRHRSSENPDSD